MDTVGTGYQLLALSGDLTSALSTPFDVTASTATTTSPVFSSASPANTSVFGEAVTFSAGVKTPFGTPTGTITFTYATGALGTAPLINGFATLTTNALAVGNYPMISASYSGDADFAGSDSPTPLDLAHTVSQADVTPVLGVSANSAVFGEAVRLTASLSVDARARDR